MLLNFVRALGRGLCGAPRWLAWLLAAAPYGLIWWSSSRPASVTPSSVLWAWLSNSAHAPLFGLWAAMLSLLVPRRDGWPHLTPAARAALLVAVALGGLLDELHQHWLSPGRDFSVLDIATDLAGAALALEIVAFAGSPGASRPGLWRRLAWAAGGSFAFGAVATWLPSCFPGVGWL